MMRTSSIRATHPLIVGFSLAIAACATPQGMYKAVPVNGAGKVVEEKAKPNDVQVSAEEVTALSSPNLGVVVVTFSNPTEEFVRVSGITLDFDEPLNEKVSVPLGDEIVSWADAITTRNSLRVRNELFLLSLIGSAFQSNFENFRRHVHTLNTGSTLMLSEIKVAKLGELAELANTVPADHLLARPFSVPPQLFARKWILLKSDARTQSCITRMFLSYQWGNNQPERLMVPFRQRSSAQTQTHSEWQEKQCAPLPPNEFGK